MPVMDGIKAAKLIQKNHKSVKTIFLSMIDQSEILAVLMKTGAKGFLLKNSNKEEVLKAIHAVHEGGTHFDPLLFSSDTNKVIKIPSDFLPRLTVREKEILKLIINEYKSIEIAETLHISLGTVETHRRNLISKLGVKNTAGLVRVAVEFQLV